MHAPVGNGGSHSRGEYHGSEAQRFEEEVTGRLGVLPNFFCTATSAPGLMEHLWGFAKSAYLDNPLPSLFKERLFVHLSRFCETRYCIVRHVGFLIGEGRPAGDARALPHTVDQALGLLNRPVPGAERLERALFRLEAQQSPVALPRSDTQLEGDLFDALTILFVAPERAARARDAISVAVGEAAFEILTAFLAFVRAAHYWTETHPTIAFEADMVAVMHRNPQLARRLLDASDAQWAHSSEALRRVLADLKRTTGTLRNTEERFRALVTATSDIVYRMSPDWSELWQLDGEGFNFDNARPTVNWLSEYIHPDDQAQVRAAIASAVAAKRVFELEHRVKRPDGTLGWTLSRAVPMLGEQGEIVEWFGAARDVTARRDVEEALRDGDRRKNEFLATLAHELRNPLAPLRSALYIAKQDCRPGTSYQRAIEIMDRQLSHLVRLVDDLRDIGCISTGKFELRREHVILREVVAVSAEACGVAMEQHGHTLIIEPDLEALSVTGDFERLTQVFSNLLSNATKYTERGGVIVVQTARQDGDAVISISDNGIGIPAADLQKIFELFSQVSAHRSRAEGGLGIGLSLVRTLVEMHRGSVSAASPGVGLGTTMVVRLPLRAAGDEGAPL